MTVEINLVLTFLFIVLVVWAAVTDVSSLKIPNWIPIALILVFAIYLFAGRNSIPVLQHVAVAVGTLAFGFAIFAGGYMGAGDVKLMTAVSLWAGPAKILPFLFFTALAGAALALVIVTATFYLRWDGSGAAPTAASRLFPRWMRRRVTPYGVAICAGALATVPALVL